MINIISISLVYIFILIFVIYLSKKLNFVDKPNSRKIHSNKIVNTGGLAIYFFLVLMVIQNEFSFEIENIIVIGFIVLLTGFLDDRFDLSPSVKLILLMFPSVYLIFNGFLLNNLGTYELIGNIELGKFGLIFTFLAVGLLINAYNYIDGIDGLLLGNSTTAIVYISFLNISPEVDKLLIYFLVCFIINLFFNLLSEKNYFKIYLGDAGSLFIGFFFSFLLIYMYLYQKIHPVYLMWACWYPVYDFLYVTFDRIKKNKKFYQPDNIHFHHYIFRKFQGSQIKTFVSINILNIIIILNGYFIAVIIGKIYSLIFFLLLFIMFFYIKKKIV